MKPLPRKKRVLNRGYLYSRTNDDVKHPSVTLLDIDTDIKFYFVCVTARLLSLWDYITAPLLHITVSIVVCMYSILK